MKKLHLNRRSVLRGMLNGAAITVALPMLDVFLSSHGDALAAEPGSSKSGGRLPVCFGTWFWPLGLSPGLWEPKKVGKDFELNEFLQGLNPIKGKFNILSGTEVFLDGKTLQVHYSPPQGLITGEVSSSGGGYGTSLDQTVAAQIGKHSRFQSISMACDGSGRGTWSSRGSTSGMNPPEVSPLALYTRLFGPGFADPNSAQFTPDPLVMLRKSVLSAVTEDRQALMRLAGTSDRARLDAYFTSVRDTEQRLALELQKPEPLAACSVPQKPTDSVSPDINDVKKAHNLFSTLTAHALACGQTRVFNVVVAMGQSQVHKTGDPESNHSHTHEERIDPKLGYQPICKSFADVYMGLYAEFVSALDSIREGDGTLLDRTLLLGFTDHGEARRHTAKKLPILLAGRAGGRMKTGIHVAAEGDTSCRAGLTCLQAMGLPVSAWGAQSNRTDRPFTEILV